MSRHKDDPQRGDIYLNLKGFDEAWVVFEAEPDNQITGLVNPVNHQITRYLTFEGMHRDFVRHPENLILHRVSFQGGKFLVSEKGTVIELSGARDCRVFHYLKDSDNCLRQRVYQNHKELA